METPWWQTLGIARLNQPAMMAQPTAAPVQNPTQIQTQTTDPRTEYEIANAEWNYGNDNYDRWINNLGWSQDKYNRTNNLWNQLEQQRINNSGYDANRFYANGEIYKYEPDAQVYRGSLSGSLIQAQEPWEAEDAAAPITPGNTTTVPLNPLNPSNPIPDPYLPPVNTAPPVDTAPPMETTPPPNPVPPVPPIYTPPPPPGPPPVDPGTLPPEPYESPAYLSGIANLFNKLNLKERFTPPPNPFLKENPTMGGQWQWIPEAKNGEGAWMSVRGNGDGGGSNN